MWYHGGVPEEVKQRLRDEKSKYFAGNVGTEELNSPSEEQLDAQKKTQINSIKKTLAKNQIEQNGQQSDQRTRRRSGKKTQEEAQSKRDSQPFDNIIKEMFGVDAAEMI